MKSLIVAILGLLSILYIINPTAGIFELIPDIYLLWEFYELAASTLLLSCLSYFGIDLFNIFKKDKAIL